MEKFSKLMENTFKLRENGTTVKTEIIAGVTTFMTMAYILAVNPNILSSTGMDHGAVFTATALAAFLGTLLMALFANYPFALAPGMGLNAYFAYTVVLGYGYSWQAALTAVFAEGIIFIVLSLTNVREAIFNSIPVSLKSAVSVGIGLFIAFIGLQNAKIVLPNSSTVAGLYSLSSYNANLQSAATLNGTEYVAGTFNDVGITVLLAVIGVILTAVLVVRNVKANMLDKNGKLPRIKGALMADAVATCAGAVLGTSTTTTFVESASGVSEGGRTGLTAVTTAILFGLALFLSPIFLAIPSFATAPALIVVGFYMLTNVVNIDFSDLSEAIPCYICIGAMPFFYSISEGIAMGVISYVAIQILSGKAKEKKISVIMYILAVLFILKYLLL